MRRRSRNALYDRALVLEALVDSFRKLDPRVQIRNPVMFVVWVGALLTLVLFFESLAGMDEGAPGFTLAISLLLWFTVVFANFAEALAEGRGRAQADTLRKARQEVTAHKLAAPGARRPPSRAWPPGCSARATSCWSRPAN